VRYEAYLFNVVALLSPRQPQSINKACRKSIDPSMLVRFRKRLSFELLGQVNEAIVKAMLVVEAKDYRASVMVEE
jgi:hypothetical protein